MLLLNARETTDFVVVSDIDANLLVQIACAA